MASLSLSTVPTTTTSLSTRPHLFSKTSSHRFKVSCKSDDHSENNPKLILPMQNVHRRNMLLGLGGLYGTANFTNIGSALAYPITAPDDISSCVQATEGIPDLGGAVRGTACCPPPSQTTPVHYHLPEVTQVRVRPAADRLTLEYIEKYQAAIAAMKALPDEDPRSWKHQGKIHCAYCNGAYSQEMNGYPNLKIQVHNSSLFFPFHRWYLYFYERILGSLINDPTFGLPYWNWDNPMGMMLPAMFEAPYPSPIPGRQPNPKFNPLFDPYRNVAHLPPSILDLNYRGSESGRNCVDLISENLNTMYKQMVSDTTANPDAFFGTNPNPEGSNILAGKVESGVHTSVHIWGGNPRMGNNEDLGNFYSAGYDPAFYAHHSNVDRMWQIWRDLDIRNVDPSNDDWLNASYVFYDENKTLVRVYNKDCVDIKKMGYTYEASRIPWLQSRPIPRVKASNVAANSVGIVKKVEEMEFPVKLDQTVKVLVKRPATKRSEDDKKKANEMLFLEGIKYNGEQFFKFDVLVDDVDDGIETTAVSSEFAGTFAQVPHGLGGGKMVMTSGAAFGLTQLLEDIEAEDDEYVLVTLVPRAGAEDATISKIKIQLVPIA